MINNIKRPGDLIFCLLSIVWIVVGVWYGARFAHSGRIVPAAIMGLFAVAAVGLWFQSRLAAWIIITFAFVGTIYSLLNTGGASVLRIGVRVLFAVWTISVLVEFLRREKS